MIKLIGIIMIGISAAMIGCQLSHNLKRRIDLLCSIRFILEEIGNEAGYGREVLPEIIGITAGKVSGIEKEWLCFLSEKLKRIGEYDFVNAWDESLMVLMKTPLKPEDVNCIRDFGKRIINRNEDRLSVVIGGYIRTLNEQVDVLRTEYAVKSRLYKSMGVLVGLFLIIIVI